MKKIVEKVLIKALERLFDMEKWLNVDLDGDGDIGETNQ
jgi:hypothetical protein